MAIRKDISRWSDLTMQNEIDKLIKEQKKTQEILLRLEKNGTFDKFFASISGEPFSWHNDPFSGIDPWNYEELNDTRAMVLAQTMLEIYQSIGKAKQVYGYIENLYYGRISDWIGYKHHLEENKKQFPRARWQDYYTNPKCLQFFEDYEKAHDITKSIYKESKNDK